MNIKRNSRGNFEISGVEFNGELYHNGEYFTGKCVTEGWEHVLVSGYAVNENELRSVQFTAYVDTHKSVDGSFTRADMKKVHDALCGPAMKGPGWDWE